MKNKLLKITIGAWIGAVAFGLYDSNRDKISQGQVNNSAGEYTKIEGNTDGTSFFLLTSKHGQRLFIYDNKTWETFNDSWNDGTLDSYEKINRTNNRITKEEIEDKISEENVQQYHNWLTKIDQMRTHIQ